MSGLVGRRRELKELEDALGATAGGHGRLLLLSGEPGIGKTRTAQEFADHAVAVGASVAWARCWEAASVPAFWPWEQVLRQLAGRALPTAPARAVTDDPDLARLRFFDDVAATVRWAAEDRPLVVVVDDLHWADVASIRLLEYLAGDVRGTGVLLLATFRDVEATPGTPVGDAIADLGRHGQHLRLVGLQVDEMPALIRTVTAVGGGGQGADPVAVHHHTGGNPLFARELVRLLDAQGSLDSLEAGDLPPVPATVRGVLAHRLTRLSADCRMVLDTGAVVGDEFGLGEVEAVTAMERGRLLEAVGEGLAAELLRETAVEGSYAFAHALVRAALYDDLGVARRVRLHERVGLALEAMRAAGHHVDLAALAHHFVKAAPGGGAIRGARYAVEAGRDSMADLAYERAVQLYQQALGALELDPSGADRCEVLLGLGTAQVAAGRMPEARATHVEAARWAREGGRSDHLARAALGLAGGGGFEVALADREQIDLLEEALRALGGSTSVLRVWLTARLSVALSLTGAEERKLALSEEGVTMARAVGDAVRPRLRPVRPLRRPGRAGRHRAPTAGVHRDGRSGGRHRRPRHRVAGPSAAGRRPARNG